MPAAILLACLSAWPVRVSPGPDPAAVTVSAPAPTGLPAGPLPQREGERLLRFGLAPDGGAMLGTYERRGADLVFTPRFRLAAGERYRATAGGAHAEYVVPPAPPAKPATVAAVYPSADDLPVNLLKFYLHFSRPMREGPAVFDRIKLLDDRGEEVEDPWRRTELWNEDATRLTLWIHPGRIKEGVNLRDDLGPVLFPDRRYTLVVSEKLLDAEGRPLGAAFKKAFRTAPAARDAISPGMWRLVAPAPGGVGPLEVRFPRPLDRALLARSLCVRGPDGKLVPGTGVVGARERWWAFRPVDPWRPGAYTLSADDRLEDLAGNTPLRPFDRDIDRPEPPAAPPPLRFVVADLPPEYPDHTDLTYTLDASGKKTPIRTAADWAIRRGHVVANFARVSGPLPTQRPPMDVKVTEEVKVGDLLRRKLTFWSDATGPVPAYLFLPAAKPVGKLPAVLALHQTTKIGKGEPAGLGNKDMAYGLELAKRGYVVLAPDYPSFGDHALDFAASGYASGTMKAVWDNVRAVDLLASLPEVDAARIGVIGHSLGGHNALFTALHEARLKAVVSSCGFSSMRKDDLPSWTGPVYMPRIRSEYGNDVNRLPFDFHEVIAGIAPRAVLAVAAEGDTDFDVTGVRDVVAAAGGVYKLLGATDRLAAHYPKGPHAFPPTAREVAYQFLDRHLKK